MFTVVSTYLTTFKISMMSGTANPSGAPEFTAGFLWGSCCSIFIFLCCVLYIIVCSFLHVGHCIICPASIYGF